MKLRTLLSTLSLIAVMSACTPDPGPVATWGSTRLARETSPAVVNHFAAWTNDDWFADITGTNGPSSIAWALNVRRRTGRSNNVLGSPQILPLTVANAFVPIQGEHFIGVDTGSGITFFRETSGVWAAAGTFTYPGPRRLMAMSDDWMILRVVTAPSPNPPDGAVEVYSLSSGGLGIGATLQSALVADPAWPAALRQGFGNAVSLDGELLAVSAQGLFAPAPGGVRVFRHGSGSWNPVQSLGGAPADPAELGRSIAVDDGATLDRLVVFRGRPTGADPFQVEVLRDDGAGFVSEQVLSGATPAELFGSPVALDGDALVLMSRSTTVPSADPLHAAVNVGYLRVYRKGSLWQAEAEIPVFVDPMDAGVTAALPFSMTMSGTHVAVGVLMGIDPPPGCPFPCPSIGYESWSVDRLGS